MIIELSRFLDFFLDENSLIEIRNNKGGKIFYDYSNELDLKKLGLSGEENITEFKTYGDLEMCEDVSCLTLDI